MEDRSQAMLTDSSVRTMATNRTRVNSTGPPISIYCGTASLQDRGCGAPAPTKPQGHGCNQLRGTSCPVPVHRPTATRPAAFKDSRAKLRVVPNILRTLTQKPRRKMHPTIGAHATPTTTSAPAPKSSTTSATPQVLCNVLETCATPALLPCAISIAPERVALPLAS